ACFFLPSSCRQTLTPRPTHGIDSSCNLESCTTIPAAATTYLANQPNHPAGRRQIVSPESPHTYPPSSVHPQRPKVTKRGGGICGVPPAERANERLCTPTLNLHRQITTPERPLSCLTCALSTAPKNTNSNLYSSPRLASPRFTSQAHLNLTSPRIPSATSSSTSNSPIINHSGFDSLTPTSITPNPIRHHRIRQQQ
ncbi:hypothetical protein CORC01_04200, partial [Colletotrichum orchidophilum]